MDDFLTSEPTMTPLVAGTSTLTIAATLASEFGLPGNITAIVISLILSSLIGIKAEVTLFKRILFYFINAITIFVIAMGLNSAGVALTQSQNISHNTLPRGDTIEQKAEKPFFHPWF